MRVVMRWLVALVLAALAMAPSALAPSRARAQQNLVVLMVDPGETQMNQARLQTAIERSTHRPIVRMTDDRAPSAHGRLTIAFSRPNRWVLRYEARGQVAWVSDRIARPGQLRDRLAELSRGLVNIIDGEPAEPASAAAPATLDRTPRRRVRPGRSVRAETGDPWNNDVILAMQDEIVDPFENEAPRRSRPVAVLWSEVINPFAESGATRASVGALWSEVLDPWASEHHRQR